MKCEVFTKTLEKTNVTLSNTTFSLLMTLAALMSFNIAGAQTTYSISSNSNWSSSIPSTCANCSINISTGVTLTIDEWATCQNCTFQGGTISMTNYSLNIQYTGNSVVTTYFKGTNFLVYGSGNITVNAPLSLSNSTFTFFNSSSFLTSYEVDLTASRVNLYDNSTMLSTGSSSTPINLMSSSQIDIGSGTQTSASIFLVSGPTINIYDKSSIVVGNENNIYYNWASYNTAPTTNTGSSAQKSYSTNNLTLNCGGSGQHACSNPALYGPATLSSGGTVSGNTLPVVLVGFTAAQNSNGTVTLDWDTQMEVNFSHFEIERSSDGSVWNTIGTVEAKGNSSIVTDYTFTDENPAANINYYRLKMVDLDNHYGYTEIKVIRSSLVSKISIFPNPTHDYVNVSLSESAGTQVTIRLINLSGQVLQEKVTAAGSGTTISLPVQQYAAGVYILSVAGSDGSHQTSKVMINRS